jgi:hypothetical protein
VRERETLTPLQIERVRIASDIGAAAVAILRHSR